LLIRKYNGDRHTVTVAADGFLWRGSTYSSLSVIAREITGTNWNGPRFFGVRVAGADKSTDVKSHSCRRATNRVAAKGPQNVVAHLVNGAAFDDTLPAKTGDFSEREHQRPARIEDDMKARRFLVPLDVGPVGRGTVSFNFLRGNRGGGASSNIIPTRAMVAAIARSSSFSIGPPFQLRQKAGASTIEVHCFLGAG